MKEIPLVDLKAGFVPIKDEVMRAIEEVLQGMQLNIGPNCQALEREFAAYCGTKYAIGVASGTEAIQFGLLASGVREGDEVITSPHTFFATAEAIACIGARPVFADVDPVTYNIDPGALEKKVTKKTKAIIPIHMYGQTSDMGPITDIAARHGLAVIEDSCQAHGALYRDKKAGAIGSAGCFSFYFTKNLGCYGEGGMVTTNDEKIDEQVRLYRNHGHKSKFEHAVVGYNGRLDEIQAAILRIKLRRLDENNTKRREKAALYNSLLKDTPLVLPAEAKDRMHVYHLYVVRSEKRDALQDHLNKNGVGTGIHYKNPVHLQEAMAGLGYKKGDFPCIEKACQEILSLPIYPELTEESQVYIAEKIKEFYKQ
ncbi:MAG: DegT/DnrJ/EryC1/StrS family aminotransferase [Nitrospirae bacterium]|nr:DegT/DnrJ/EryC1/StrS family aminotransferase [Nitrospirota bacterium]